VPMVCNPDIPTLYGYGILYFIHEDINLAYFMTKKGSKM